MYQTIKFHENVFFPPELRVFAEKIKNFNLGKFLKKIAEDSIFRENAFILLEDNLCKVRRRNICRWWPAILLFIASTIVNSNCLSLQSTIDALIWGQLLKVIMLFSMPLDYPAAPPLISYDFVMSNQNFFVLPAQETVTTCVSVRL